MGFLISRQLAELSADGAFLMATMAGHEMGEIADERLSQEPPVAAPDARDR
jgi:hypothetical protein